MIRSHLFLYFLSTAKRSPSLDSQSHLHIGFLVLGRESICQICRYDKNLTSSYTLCSQRRCLSVFLKNKTQQFISVHIDYKTKRAAIINGRDGVEINISRKKRKKWRNLSKQKVLQLLFCSTVKFIFFLLPHLRQCGVFSFPTISLRPSTRP